jgi:hypothetical protein
MRSLPAVLGSGILAALGLYGLLAAVERPLPAGEDPWLDAWRRAGLKAEFQEEQAEPERRLIFQDGRSLFRKPELASIRLRRYVIENVAAQVIALPSRESLPEIPEGRTPGFRLRPKGGTINACRSGRWLLLQSVTLRTGWFTPSVPVDSPDVARAFEAFERVAGALP